MSVIGEVWTPASTCRARWHCASGWRAASERPFACFTFDDGYRDNRDFAYPIFERRRLPFAIYVPADFADGNGDLWWLTLEEVLRAAPHLTLDMNGDGPALTRSRPSPRRRRPTTRSTGGCARSRRISPAPPSPSSPPAHGVDPRAAQAGLIMSWDELRELAKDPLVTIGAHTRRIWRSPSSPSGRRARKWRTASPASRPSSGDRAGISATPRVRQQRRASASSASPRS